MLFVLTEEPPNLEPTPVPPHPVIPGYFENEDERRALLARLFDESAEFYDPINDRMSFGSGSRYRKQVLIKAGLRRRMSLLDVGCGTGVIAGHAREIVGPTGRVVGVDPSESMLAVARSKGRITESYVAKGESLPLEDSTFDMVTMGYALRHVNDLRQAFREYKRVLQPGGTVMILEITPPKSRVAYQFLKRYIRTVVPLITKLTTRSSGAHELMSYYWDTIELCVPPELILDTMRAVGFSDVQRNVVLGIFSEYSGTRPEDEASSS